MAGVSTAVGVPPDGGHGWVIVGASSIVYGLSGGIFFAQGFLYSEFLKSFGASEAVTAWVCSIMTGLCLLSAMVSGWFLDTVGHRTLCIVGSFLAGAGFIISAFVYDLRLFFFTYSVTIGMGLGIQYISAIMIPQLYFDKKRAIATGITVSGAPAGGMIMTPLIQYFIATVGWRATMMLVGAITLNGCAMGILMVPPYKLKKVPSFPDVKNLEPPEPRPLARLKVDMGSVMLQSIENMRSAISLEMKDSEAETKCQMYAKKLSKIFDISALKRVITLVVLGNYYLFGLGYVVPFVFLPLYTSQFDIDPTTTATIFSVMAAADFLGRIILGVLGNCECLNSIHLFGACSIMPGIACILSIFANSTPSFYVFGFVFGFSVGGWVCISTVSLSELLGVENLAKSYGVMQIAGSMAHFTTSPLHALMMEASGSKRVPFISAGICMILGGLTLLLYYHTCFRRSSHKQSFEKDEENPAEFKEPPNIVLTLPTDNLQPGETESLSEVATVA